MTMPPSTAPPSSSLSRLRGDSIGSAAEEEQVKPSRTANKLPPSPKLRKKDLHPVVASMVSGNTLRDCHQVKDFYGHCLIKSPESHVCKTAARYHDICSREGGK